MIKKKLYFGGELTEEFLRDIKCSSSISTTNMVLFDVDGHIRRFNTVQQILESFYGGRLAAYSQRKRAMLKSMEHSLLKISNQAKFVLKVIDGSLKVSNRKRLDVVRDLRDNGFAVWTQSKSDSNTLKKRARSTDGTDDEEEAEGDGDGDVDVGGGGGGEAALKRLSAGYKYLLSMPISSLTEEKVRALLKLQEETEHEVETLRQKSVWRMVPIH